MQYTGGSPFIALIIHCNGFQAGSEPQMDMLQAACKNLPCDEEAAPFVSPLKQYQAGSRAQTSVLQVEYENLACDEEAAPCGATCDKLLPCGRHHCAERCHHGRCTTVCRAMVDKECACGKTHKVVQCHETLRCVPAPDAANGFLTQAV